jgi:hypothetical protein
MTTYQVRTRAGRTHVIEHDLSDRECQEILAKKDELSRFEDDLCGRNPDRLSYAQRAWLHILAEWTANPKPREESGQKFPKILEMLTRARDAQKRLPKIEISHNGKPVVFKITKAGKVNVTDGGPYGANVWYGSIQPNGDFRVGRETARVIDAIVALEADPARVASQHGVATGSCCFCNRDLTTKESRSVGYGPICADKFGLPWGEIDSNLDIEGKIVPEL